MFREALHPFVLLGMAIGLSGCATPTPANRNKLAGIHSVAVNYESQGRGASDSTGGRIAGRVARHGAGFALGQAGLGFVGGIIGLAVDVADIATPSSEPKVSGSARRLLHVAGADPLSLVAQRTEQEISRRRLFALGKSNPDAVFNLELRQLKLDPVDARNLSYRATLAVTARLLDRKGAVLWSKDAAATSVRAQSSREYSERPRLARDDFDGLAAVVSRQLLADFPR